MKRSAQFILCLAMITNFAIGQHTVNGMVLLENAYLMDGTEVNFIERTVSSKNGSALTNALGVYELTLQTGIYDIEVSHPGYYPAFIEEVILTQDLTMDEIFLEAPIELNGFCRLDGQTDHSGISILIEQQDGANTVEVTTNIAGRFEAYLQRGTYNISMQKETYIPNIIESYSIDGPGTLGEYLLPEYPTGGSLSLTYHEADVIPAGSYIVDQYVGDSGELIIEPGAKFYFQENGTLSAQGPIRAIGTPENPIIFTNYPGETPDYMFYQWDSTEAPLTQIFENCVFTGNMNSMMEFNNGLYTGSHGDSIKFITCQFVDLNINTNLFRMYGGTLSETGGQAFTLDKCLIQNVLVRQDDDDRTMIEIAHLSVDIVNSHINDNTIRSVIQANEYGVGKLRIQNTIFSRNSSTDWVEPGLLIVGSLDTLEIDRCLFYENASDTGIVTLWGGTDFKLTNSVSINNGRNTFTIYGDEPMEIKYNCFYEPTANDHIFEGNSFPTLIGDIVDNNYNNDPCDLYQNIYMDPLLMDATNGDFTLAPLSPAIDAGDPAGETDPDGTIPDLGPYPYFQGPHPILQVTPDVTFENVEINQNAQGTLLVENIGDLDLIISSIVAAGDGFNLTWDTLPITIPANGSNSISVTFSPNAIREYSSIVAITSNDRNVQVIITGNGIPPEGANPTSLIIAGGGDTQTNWEYFSQNTNPSTNETYLKMAYGRYYGDTRLHYMNPIAVQDWDGDGVDDEIVDESTITPATVETAIGSLVDDLDNMFPNVLFFAGHGYVGELDINGSASDNVGIADLSSWITSANLETNTPLVVVFEACFSGGFVQPLAANNRVVISACREDQFADYLNGESFSTRFWEEIWYGNSVGAAFDVASDWSFFFLNQQEPYLDADGNGIPNEESDFVIADGIYLGGEFQHGAVLPAVQDAPEFVNILGESINVWTTFNRRMDRVWCRLVPINYSGTPSFDQLPTFELEVESGFRYSVDLNVSELFTLDEDYIAIIYGVADFYNSIVPRHIQLKQEVVSIDPIQLLPEKFEVSNAYPNPFNPSTTVRYGLPEAADVGIVIYDILGRQIRSWEIADQKAGWYNLNWNGIDKSGNNVQTGVYLARIQAGSYSKVVKMLYLK